MNLRARNKVTADQASNCASIQTKAHLASKSSAERVRLFRERQKQRAGYNHDLVKEAERKRIAALRALKQKCVGQKMSRCIM